jgi:hypothetical protein
MLHRHHLASRPAALGAVLVALAAPTAIAQRADANTPATAAHHGAAPRTNISDEALEYVSLGRAVEHAAREQRRHALAARPPARFEGGGSELLWLAPTGAAGLALVAISGALAVRSRRRAQPGV